MYMIYENAFTGNQTYQFESISEDVFQVFIQPSHEWPEDKFSPVVFHQSLMALCQPVLQMVVDISENRTVNLSLTIAFNVLKFTSEVDFYQ